MTKPPGQLSLLLITLASCAALPRAQCSDPSPPVGGFAVSSQADALVTYSDQFRTRADASWPNATPGRCGWPLVVIVHGFPTSKRGFGTWRNDFAKAGYFAVAYDVRGQGSTVALNPGRGTTLMALAEWIDMFEIMEWAKAKYPNLVDMSRIGVVGFSQGGIHAFAAASWSGRTPPANPRRSRPFPAVRAAVPIGAPASFIEAATLDGTAVKNTWSLYAYRPATPQLAFDPGFQQTLQRYLGNDDPYALATWARNDPGREYFTGLRQTRTPVFAIISWLEAGPRSILQAIDSMPATTPRRVFLTTGFHGTPKNDYQSAIWPQYRDRWFARFLKGANDPIETGPRVFNASVPANGSVVANPSSLWRHRADHRLPPADAATHALHLRSGSRLTVNPPSGTEVADRISHRVAAGYGARQFAREGAGSPATRVYTRIPLSTASYTSAPITSAMEVAGSPRVVLRVSPDQPRFLLAAEIQAVPPSGTPQRISNGAIGTRRAGAQTVSIPMAPINTVLDSGTRIRLTIRNHVLSGSGTRTSVSYVPYFVSSEVDIEHSAGNISQLLLPIRAQPRLDVSTATTSVSLTNPARIDLSIRSAPAYAGSPYLILASLTASGPALPLPGGDLWLGLDAATTSFASLANSALLPGFQGTLDAQGGASAAVEIAPLAPLPATLSGRRLHLAPMFVHNGQLGAGAPALVTFE